MRFSNYGLVLLSMFSLSCKNESRSKSTEREVTESGTINLITDSKNDEAAVLIAWTSDQGQSWQEIDSANCENKECTWPDAAGEKTTWAVVCQSDLRLGFHIYAEQTMEEGIHTKDCITYSGGRSAEELATEEREGSHVRVTGSQQSCTVVTQHTYLHDIDKGADVCQDSEIPVEIIPDEETTLVGLEFFDEEAATKRPKSFLIERNVTKDDIPTLDFTNSIPSKSVTFNLNQSSESNFIAYYESYFNSNDKGAIIDFRSAATFPISTSFISSSNLLDDESISVFIAKSISLESGYMIKLIDFSGSVEQDTSVNFDFAKNLNASQLSINDQSELVINWSHEENSIPLTGEGDFRIDQSYALSGVLYDLQLTIRNASNQGDYVWPNISALISGDVAEKYQLFYNADFERSLSTEIFSEDAVLITDKLYRTAINAIFVQGQVIPFLN